MKTIFYDLTELLYLSGSTRYYYGIARVVAEGAREAFRLDPSVRYVAYSQAHDAFIEIFPSLDDDGDVHLNIPNPGLLYFTRRIFGQRRRLAEGLARLQHWATDLHQRRRWARTGVAFSPVDLTGGIFVSAARPKLMIHAVAAIRAQFPGTQVHALVHDMMPLHAEKGFNANRFTSSFHADNCYLIERADQIIANSRFTADDTMAFVARGALPAPRRIAVAQLAHECREGDEPAKAQVPEGPFVLMVGTSLGRKNLNVVLEAMRLITERGEVPPRLALAGRERKRTAKYLAADDMAQVRPHVVNVRQPNQTDLARLYRASLAVVLPSEIEGWGLPAAEALWFGVPALCSDIPVLHEVCGDLGLYFGLRDAPLLADYLMRLKDDAAFRAARLAAIAEARGDLRTWQDYTRDLLAALQPARG